MSAPPTIPQWDSNGTHTTALVAGHKTDGFAHDEVPASDELNTWMMLVYLWILWFSGNASTAWQWLVPTASTVGSGTPADPTFPLTTNATIRCSLDVAVGQTITGYGFSGTAFAGGGVLDAFSVKLKNSNGTVDTSTFNAFVVPLADGMHKVILGAPHAVVDGVAYWIDIAVSAASNATGNIKAFAVQAGYV